jgi:hypothetical protein
MFDSVGKVSVQNSGTYPLMRQIHMIWHLDLAFLRDEGIFSEQFSQTRPLEESGRPQAAHIIDLFPDRFSES